MTPPPHVPGIPGMPLPSLKSTTERTNTDSSEPPAPRARVDTRDDVARERARDAKDQLSHVWQKLDEQGRELLELRLQVTEFQLFKKELESKKTDKTEHKKLFFGLATGAVVALIAGYFQLRSAMISAAVSQSASNITNKASSDDEKLAKMAKRIADESAVKANQLRDQRGEPADTITASKPAK